MSLLLSCLVNDKIRAWFMHYISVFVASCFSTEARKCKCQQCEHIENTFLQCRCCIYHFQGKRSQQVEARYTESLAVSKGNDYYGETQRSKENARTDLLDRWLALFSNNIPIGTDKEWYMKSKSYMDIKAYRNPDDIRILNN